MSSSQSTILSQPPAWARKFLYWYCKPELAEEIDGDLMETFKENLKIRGVRSARFNYALDVIRFLRPFTLTRDLDTLTPNHFAMIKNYIVVAYRSLMRKIGFSLINIFGLSVGITCCLLIMMYVQYETSYDGFHTNGDNVYRIALDRIYPDREVSYAVTPHSFPPQMVEDFPEVKNETMFVSTRSNFSVTFRYGNKFFDEGNVLFADSSFFKLITAKMVAGDPKEALRGPNKLVLTESTARKYFGDEDPIGKSLETNPLGNQQQNTWLVTGVVKDFPENSHLTFDLIISNNTFQFLQNENWMGFSVFAYIELEDGTPPEVVEAKFPEMIKKYAAGQIQQATGQSFEEYTAAGHGYHYYLQSIKDIHLTSNLEAEIKPNSSWSYIYILLSIAAFILLIACINFMNLSTARSSERAKEVGLRKVLGSVKKLLIYQFLTESILLSMFSTILSLGLVYSLLPFFNILTGVELTLATYITPINVAIVVATAFLIGILAGFYPAFILSGFTPVAVLKGRIQNSKGGKYLRDGLVTFQFAISIVLISSTLIIYDQMNFISNKSLGFDSEQMLILDNTNQLNERGEVFREELLRNENITSAAFVGSIPGDVHPGFVAQLPGANETQVILSTVLDENALETLNIPIAKGRGFSRQFNDSLSMIINETALKTMGFEDPIGKRVGSQNPNDPEEIIFFTIVGVVNDYHFQSLHTDIGPLVFLHSSSAAGPQAPGVLNKIAMKVNGNMSETLLAIESQWNEFMPNSPFNYYFLDGRLQEFYNAEKASSRIFTVFTTLAIIIACVGLFGLAAYTASLKTKEIGIRKVLGASVIGIVVLLSKEFTKLILIALVIAVPTAYYGMDLWLQDFAYRININPTSFVLAGVIAILIGWITVSFQSLKAAVVNPVNSLRSE